VSNIAPWCDASRPREGDERCFSRLSRDPLHAWGCACGCEFAKSRAEFWDLAESAEAAADGGGPSAAMAGSAVTAEALVGSTPTGVSSSDSDDTACPVATTGDACVSAQGSACCPAGVAAGGVFSFFFNWDGSSIPQDKATQQSMLQVPISLRTQQERAKRVWSAETKQQSNSLQEKR